MKQKIEKGFELIGFAIKTDPDGSILSIGFQTWKRPIIMKQKNNQDQDAIKDVQDGVINT